VKTLKLIGTKIKQNGVVVQKWQVVFGNDSIVFFNLETAKQYIKFCEAVNKEEQAS